MEKADAFKAISLFSGAQGLDVGLGLAGINIVLGQDVEPSCIATMTANGHRGVLGDIRTMQAETLLAETGMVPGEPFLVCGGPPCQPFSTAGKRLGVNDPKGGGEPVQRFCPHGRRDATSILRNGECKRTLVG